MDETHRAVDFVRWTALDGTASRIPPPVGTAWSGELVAPGFARSLSRRSDLPDGDTASDFESAEPTLGMSNSTRAVHRTFFPERDVDVVRWTTPADGVYTLQTRRLRSGAEPQLELWTATGERPFAISDTDPSGDVGARVTLRLAAGQALVARLSHAGSLTRWGAYDLALFAEADPGQPLPPQGVLARVLPGGGKWRVRLEWWNSARYDSLSVQVGAGAALRLAGDARSWEATLARGRHRIDLTAFARGVAAPGPPLTVAVEDWPTSRVDEFDALDPEDWEITRDWGLAASPGRSGMCLADSPDGPYRTGVLGGARLRAAVQVELGTSLGFDHICIVRPEDAALVEVSDDWGARWQRLARFDWNSAEARDGTVSWRDGRADPGDWLHEDLPLGRLAGRPIQVRFRLTSDWSGVADGWYIDHVTVGPEELYGPRALPAIRLGPNAPNPFNPSTRISFEMSRAGFATLRLFDVRARLVRVLWEGRAGSGPHEVVWDGRDRHAREAASGVYFCQLRALGQMQSRKLTLAR